MPILPAGDHWIGRLLLLAAGAAMALALPPWHFLPAILLFALLDRASVGAFGLWLFAFGYHLAGLNWIAIAFYAEAERFGALAIPGVIALSIILATIAWIAVAFVRRIMGGDDAFRPLVLATGWTLAELLRGPWGTQFPWNPTSLIWSVTDATSQPIAWLGSELFGFLTLLAVMAVGRAVATKTAFPGLAGLGVLAAFALFGYARLPLLTVDENGPVLHLVQANIAQHHKWDAERRRAWFFEHVDLSSHADGPPDILIWPESSVPYSLENTTDAGPLVGQSLAPGGIALVGSDFVDRDRDPILLHNSVYALDHTGAIVDRYDKVNLVPFGEFLPFRNLLAPLGLEALAVGSVDFQAGEARRSLRLPGLPEPSPLVCFEAVFAGMATPVDERPQWLLNVTNDAWFGISAGPYQHMNMARMRAIETGLPLVRAANTGISVVTDAYGRVVDQLPLGAKGAIRAVLPRPLSDPPLAGQHRAIPWLAFLACTGMCWFAVRAIQKRRSPK